MSKTRVALLALALSSALLGAACGSDDEPPAATGESPAAETTTTTAGDDASTTTTAEDDAETTTTAGDQAGAGDTVEIVGVDYAFEDVPESIESGTTLTFRNDSEEEAHELVAFLIPEGESRPVEELVQLPEAELGQVFGGEPEPATVIVAAPGEEGMAVVGDGTLTEPGRYALVCFIPVGADPAVVMDPEATGPPASDAPPHAARGMVAELTVE